MAGEESSAEDRTEGATARRLEQAREQGQVPVSRDLTMLASLTGASVGCVWIAPPMIERMTHQTANLLAMVGELRLEDGTLLGALAGVLLSAILVVSGIALPAASCGIACVLLQTQFYIGSAPIAFKVSRISPMAGLGRLLSWRHLLDFLKALGRLGVLILLAWSVLQRSPVEAVGIMGSDVAWLLPAARNGVQNLVRPLLIALACFAALDLFLVRMQHARSMRMTREQVRLERRDSDGDPFIKSKLKRIRAQRAKKRMMEKVKGAAVVITNPTHYAVALSYERGVTAAPRVIAKGADFLAARIREEATLHGVPIVPNPPLARALYLVELDHEIPGEHYRAVAEVIAFVWKLKARMSAGGARL